MTLLPTKLQLIPYVLIDNQGIPYLWYNASDIPRGGPVPYDPNVSSINVASFLSERMRVSKRSSALFSGDLTTRDDLILTILSLLLLLVIESILTAVLLRTYNGSASNFGFSIKQFIELARQFKFRGLIRGNPVSAGRPPNKINVALLLVASATLILTFWVEVAVLWLSTPEFIEVTNRKAAFTYIETLRPDWNFIRDNAGSAANRPCLSITIVGNSSGTVKQGNTRITPCLVATGDLSASVGFQTVSDEVDLKFETRNHLFGAEHQITIGKSSANYKMIVYYTLNDRRRNILYKRSYFLNHEAGTFYLHRQFVAFLFNEYVRRTNDTRMNLERLLALNLLFNSTVEDGGDVVVSQINRQQKFKKVTSTLLTTTVRGVLPRGDAALRFAVAFLKGSTGVAVRGPDLNDMDSGSANMWASERKMWLEESRRLNWFTMTILLAAAVAVLIVLRYLLKPIGTAEIAGAYVSKQVGAELGRPVALMGRDEKTTFSLILESEGIGRISDILSNYSDKGSNRLPGA